MKTLKVVGIVLLALIASFGRSRGQTVTTFYTLSGSGSVNPLAGLIQGSDGSLYGTTYNGGGSSNCVGGCGTVFRIDLNGTFTRLYSFTYNSDGARPWALVQGSDGNFYGTTAYGGSPCGCGTIFRISPTGDLTNLHSLSSVAGEGLVPFGGLIQGSDGDFYGTTCFGGSSEEGTVFRISPTGTFTNLYSFTAAATEPARGLVWYRAATAISMAPPREAGRVDTARYSESVPVASTALYTPLPVSPTTERIHMLHWCRAATATSMARPTQAGRPATARCSESLPVASTALYIPLPVPPTTGPIHMPGWCRAATAIFMVWPLMAGHSRMVPFSS